MRKLLGLLLCFGLCITLGFSSVGCSKKKDDKKPSTTKKEGDKKTDGDKDKITLAADDATVEAGKKTSVKVTASKKATDDMELTFTSEAKDVEFSKATIKKGAESATVDVTAGEKAKAWEGEVTVKSGKAEGKFKLTVKEKKAAEGKKAKIKLSAGEVAIKLDKDKNGKGTAKISATRTDYDGAIELKFGKAKGVTVKDTKIDKGKDSVEVEVAVMGDDAETEVTVTGTGGEATDETTLKLKIKAK